MSLSFSEQIKGWRNKTSLRMQLVFQESVQELVLQANEPRAKGGNMPIRTGFLVNSTSAAINSVPTGQSVAPDNYSQSSWDMTDFLLVVNAAEIGDRVTVGYTANYAQYMEARYAFLRLAAQNWPQIVKGVVKSTDERIASRGNQ